MVGHRRTGHLHHGGDVENAFLAVAQQPENTNPGRIVKLLEYFRNRLKIVYMVQLLL